MKFKIVTLGCKVNAYESEMIKEKMLLNNYIETNDDDFDIAIVNTCSVTNMADAKSRKVIRNLRNKNKDGILVVCGCSSENKREELLDLDINILIGNSLKSMIPDLIGEYLSNHKQIVKFFDSNKLTFEDMFVNKFSDQTRAYIKIQDGCNNFCAYCIIPYTRGRIRSKDMDQVILEAKTLVSNGHKEIVLTGIDTGNYGKDKNYDLTDLLNELVKIDGLERIRLSSIDIYDLDDKFIECYKNNDKLCNHLHISLQSGCDKILKSMFRKYDTKYFIDKINKIRSIRKDISITTDIIVGFPGETEDDFIETYNFAKNIGFSKIHVFPFSKRNGTKAASMDNQVKESDKTNRVDKLIRLSNELEYNYNSNYLNKEVEVLIEEIVDGKSIGHTSNYLKVVIDGVYDKNTFVKVSIYKVDVEEVYAK